MSLPAAYSSKTITTQLPKPPKPLSLSLSPLTYLKPTLTLPNPNRNLVNKTQLSVRSNDDQSIDHTVSWTSSIARRCRNGMLSDAAAEFVRMRLSGVEPNHVTFVTLLSACADFPSKSLRFGSSIHGYIRKLGFDKNNVSLGTSLVGMYSKCAHVDLARHVFDEMCVKNSMSWNTMIDGYMRNGDVEDAIKLFDQMPKRDKVSWTALIGGFVKKGHFEEALEWFREMQLSGVEPDYVTIIAVLSAIANLGTIGLGIWVHRYVLQQDFKENIRVSNSLIDMYSRCGCIEFARQEFNNMQKRSLVSWNSIIVGFAINGHAEDALEHFSMMHKEGFKPDGVSFTGALTACSHAGLVNEGLQFYDTMKRVHRIPPRIEHYGCVVDLLSRAGRLNEAEDLINSMPIKPNVIVWGALLGGCRIYRDVKRGERVVQHILELDSGHSGSYVYLANVYASMGRLDDAASCRLKMREHGVKKTPGCSWIEVNNTVHVFVMGDRSHPQTDKIYSMINELGSRMKLAGYKPNTDLVVHCVNEEEKESALSTHSEKLAIAFGLISTSEGTTIRVVKNLRVCTDCHEATKIISRIVGREIIVRDRSRFHMFKDGRCSCNDYW